MPLLLCPNDGAGMQEINRNGVLIDVCPTCRGVWLDRGEMEKLLGFMREDDNPDFTARDDPNYRNARRNDDDERYKYKKKHSIFDFFD
jgi:uncharacterized protein